MSRETRKTKDGRYVLRAGEYERNGQKGFIFKWRDQTGRQCSVSALTLKELLEKEDQVQKDRLDGLKRTYQKRTLNDYFEVWQKQKSGLKANTYSNYVYMYERFVRNSSIGKKAIKGLTKSDIKTFYKNLKDGKRNGRKQDSKPVAVNTLDVLQNVLHQVIEVAVDDDAIRRNVSDGTLKEPKAEFPAEKREALTLEERARFMEVIKDTPWEPIFTVMMWTGMRVGEVTGLTWDDVDEAEGVIHVCRTLVYYKDQNTGKMERRINTTKTTAGFRDLPMNEEIRAGVSAAVIMKMMGHKDVQMTLGTYASIQKDMMVAADKALQEYLHGNSEHSEHFSEQICIAAG